MHRSLLGTRHPLIVALILGNHLVNLYIHLLRLNILPHFGSLDGAVDTCCKRV